MESNAASSQSHVRRPRILMVNDESRLDGPEKTGFVLEGLERSGASFTWVDLSRDEKLPASFDGFDGLVLTGGAMSVFDDDKQDRVARLIECYQAFDTPGKPTLGLCLGAQIMARAHGSRVERMDRMQFGFERVRTTDAARDDPIFGAMSGEYRVFEAHRDRIVIADGGVALLVGEEEPNQVFRFAETGYAFQCHFEATRDLVVEWSDMIKHDLGAWLGEDAAVARQEILDDLDDVMPQAELFARQVMNGWMGLFQ